MKKYLISLLIVLIFTTFAFGQGIITISKKKGCTGWNCNFATDSDLVALYQFENNANRGEDTKGTNDLSEHYATSAPSLSSDVKMEGTYSVDVNAGYRHGYYLADASLSADFPGKSGEGCVKTFSACYWVYYDSGGMPTLGDLDYHVGKYYASSGDRSWRIQLYYTGSPAKKRIYLSIAHAETGETKNHESDLAEETWYFVCATYDNADKSYSIRIRDASGNAVGSDVTGTFTLDANKMVCGDYEFFINNGSLASSVGRLSGYFDEVSIWKKVLTSDEVTAISQGTYGE
jgi:hypothetical protein